MLDRLSSFSPIELSFNSSCQNNQLPTKSHDELKDNSNVFTFSSIKWLLCLQMMEGDVRILCGMCGNIVMVYLHGTTKSSLNLVCLDHSPSIRGLSLEVSCENIEPVFKKVISISVVMKNKEFIIVLLKSLPSSYKYLITSLKTVPMKEFTMNYFMAGLVH